MTTPVWYYDPGHNFGDMLTPIILAHYGLMVRNVPEKNNKYAKIIGIGSLVQAIPNDYPGFIWSCGLMKGKHKKHFPKARIYALRGSLSKIRVIGNYTPEFALGDGGLLLSDVYGIRDATPTYKLGIVPHYVDYETVTRNVKFASDPNVLVINVRQPVAQVAKQMQSCACILSSSLHGLIVADAFQIPNRQFRVSTSAKIGGGMFKYQDYYSCFPMQTPTPLVLRPFTTLINAIQSATSTGARPNLEQVKARLRNATKAMVTHFIPSVSDITLTT